MVRPPVLYVNTKFQADSSFHSKVIGDTQNFECRSRNLGHANLGVALYSVRWKRSVLLHLCTKFEAGRSIRSKVIKGVLKFGN